MDDTQRSEWICALYERQYDALIVQGNRYIHYDPVLSNWVEDCVNETFEVAFCKSEDLHTREQMEGWLVDALKKKLNNVRAKASTRTSRTAVPLDSAEGSLISDPVALQRMEAWFAENEAKDVLDRLTKQLSKTEKEILDEYFVKGKRVRVIQEERGTSESAVRAAIHRIRRKARLLRKQERLTAWLLLGFLLPLCWMR